MPNEHSCTHCSFSAKNKGGLSSHMRKHAREGKDSSAAMSKPSVVERQVQPEPKPPSGGVCRSCHALPVGSVELVSLLLVLIFSLTAVLLTSIYALEVQEQELTELEARVG